MLGLHFGGVVGRIVYSTLRPIEWGRYGPNKHTASKDNPFFLPGECDVFLVIMFLVITPHTHEFFTIYTEHGYGD